MAEETEASLDGRIDELVREFDSRIQATLEPPGPAGHSARVLTALVAVAVEYDNRFAELVPLARRFDMAVPGRASRRLETLAQERRSKLTEASYLAAFKVVYEEYRAYERSVPVLTSAEATPGVLGAALERMGQFESTFRGFEARAAQLAADGLLPSMQEKWLSPMANQARQNADAIRARLGELQTPPLQTPPRLTGAAFWQAATAGKGVSVPVAAGVNIRPQVNAQPSIDAYNAMLKKMEDAVKAIQDHLDHTAAWVERPSLFRLIGRHQQEFLTGISGLTASAQALADGGQPALLNAIQAARKDVEGANAIVMQMAAGQQATSNAQQAIAAKANDDLMKHMEEMHRIQERMTAGILEYKPSGWPQF